MCQPGRPAPQGEGHEGSPGFGVLPQHEIERIELEFVDLHPRARAQLVDLLAGKRTVARKFAHRIHHIAVRREVGVSLVDQRLRHGDDGRDELGRARLEIRDLQPERRTVLLHGEREAPRELGPVLAVLRRALNDLVVDVGDVANVGDLEAARAQVALHQIEHRQHPRVTEVNVVVHGDAADVHAHFVAAQRLELRLAAGQRIMNFEHGTRVGGAPFPAASTSAAAQAPDRVLWPVSATRNGMKSSAPLRPVRSFSIFVSTFRSGPASSRASAAAAKNSRARRVRRCVVRRPQRRQLAAHHGHPWARRPPAAPRCAAPVRRRRSIPRCPARRRSQRPTSAARSPSASG